MNTRGTNGEYKLRHLTDFIRTHRLDFLFLQETNIATHYNAKTFINNLGLKRGIYSLGTHNNGTFILQTSDRWEITQHTSDNTTGRVTTATITNKNTTYKLVNIYAPQYAHHREQFYEGLIDTLASNTDKLILGGDFNITLDDRDITGTDIGKGRYGRKRLQTIIDAHNLKDSYRVIYPQGTDTTYKNIGIDRAVRIDRIHIYNTCTVTNTTHLEQTLRFTDHKAVITTINESRQTKRTQPWKFNNTLLHNEEYTQNIANLLQYKSQNIPTENIKKIWDDLKETIKQITIRTAQI